MLKLIVTEEVICDIIDFIYISFYNIQMSREATGNHVENLGTHRLDIPVNPEFNSELSIVQAVVAGVNERIKFTIGARDPFVPEGHDPEKEKLEGDCSVMAFHTSSTLRQQGFDTSIGQFDGHTICVARGESSNVYFASPDQPGYTIAQKTDLPIGALILGHEETIDPRIDHVTMSCKKYDLIAKSANYFRPSYVKPFWLRHGKVVGSISVPQYAYLALEGRDELLGALEANDTGQVAELIDCTPVFIEAGTTPQTNQQLKEFNEFLMRSAGKNISPDETIRLVQAFFDRLPEAPSKYATEGTTFKKLSGVFATRGFGAFRKVFRDLARENYKTSQRLATS